MKPGERIVGSEEVDELGRTVEDKLRDEIARRGREAVGTEDDSDEEDDSYDVDDGDDYDLDDLAESVEDALNPDLF